jgi:hypothetical protein
VAWWPGGLTGQAKKEPSPSLWVPEVEDGIELEESGQGIVPGWDGEWGFAWLVRGERVDGSGAAADADQELVIGGNLEFEVLIFEQGEMITGMVHGPSIWSTSLKMQCSIVTAT